MRDYIYKEVKVIMDRPLGSKHPKHGFTYPINYGYIPNTISGDGMEIDAYIIGESIPLKEYTGFVVAIIEREYDVEDKLVVCKDKEKYTKDEIQNFIQFQEQYFISRIIMKRDM